MKSKNILPASMSGCTFEKLRKGVAMFNCSVSQTGFNEIKLRVKGSPKGDGAFFSTNNLSKQERQQLYWDILREAGIMHATGVTIKI